MLIIKSQFLLLSLSGFGHVSSFSHSWNRKYVLNVVNNIQLSTRENTHLFAADGPPQYDKFDAVMSNVEMLSDGSAMLHIETKDSIDYKAGNVLALEMEVADGMKFENEKNQLDANKNGGWMRGPYTISRSTEKSFDILVKTVGDKSKAFASAKPGTPLKFGGKFKVPIVEGIDVVSTKRVVLLSTGVGVGPCIGAIEEIMKSCKDFPPVELYASYRTQAEVICPAYLDSLDITWRPIITSEQGRISASLENLKMILPSNDSALSLEDTHYHIIGNGQMVKEWKEGLAKAGVPEGKVTVEMYHNFQSDTDSEAVNRIATTISQCCVTA